MVGMVLLPAGTALYHHYFLKDQTLKGICFKRHKSPFRPLEASVTNGSDRLSALRHRLLATHHFDRHERP
jgi:hypothetical protein